ncbi:MAG: YicC family protein [Bacteroidetes bacterium]|nr:YicC family protein [Bacteroidota bacterium]
MVRSMTGYGNVKGMIGGQNVTVEIRSLNSKFLELNLRMPLQFRDRELELRAELSKQLERGKADLNISFDNNDLAKRSSVNKEIFNAYFEELSALGKEYHLSDVNLFDLILRMPAVMNTERSEVDETQWKDLKALLSQAIERFNGFRDNEGVALSQDITARVHTILNSIPRLEAFEQVRVDNIRARLDKAISEMRDQANIDRNRFEQELIFYIEKLDISEEKVRLKSHCDYFVQTLDGPEANGKKLGFITQEIGREINTIGAKANDAAMQRIVVEMKDELEKLKEQLANVL